MLKLTPYAGREAQGSSALYISHPRLLAVHFQRTELGTGLLDVELRHSRGDDAGRVLIRFEGNATEMEVLAEAIVIALQNPRPHPSSVDLFETALIDLEILPLGLRRLRDHENATGGISAEVDRARARVGTGRWGPDRI